MVRSLIQRGEWHILENSLPEEVWGRLKTWAKARAHAAASPSIEECAEYVRETVRSITGREDALRTDAVRFYAAEAFEMIANLSADGACAARPASDVTPL